MSSLWLIFPNLLDALSIAREGLAAVANGETHLSELLRGDLASRKHALGRRLSHFDLATDGDRVALLQVLAIDSHVDPKKFLPDGEDTNPTGDHREKDDEGNHSQNDCDDGEGAKANTSSSRSSHGDGFILRGGAIIEEDPKLSKTKNTNLRSHIDSLRTNTVNWGRIS